MQPSLLHQISQQTSQASSWNCLAAQIPCSNWQSTPVLQHAYSWKKSAGEILNYFLKDLAFCNFNPISLVFEIYFPHLNNYFQNSWRHYHIPVQLSFPKIVFFCKLWIFVIRKREISLWLDVLNPSGQVEGVQEGPWLQTVLAELTLLLLTVSDLISQTWKDGPSMASPLLCCRDCWKDFPNEFPLPILNFSSRCLFYCEHKEPIIPFHCSGWWSIWRPSLCTRLSTLSLQTIYPNYFHLLLISW